MSDFYHFFNGIFYGLLIFIGFRSHAVLDAMLAENNPAVLMNLVLLGMLVISLFIVRDYREKASKQ